MKPTTGNQTTGIDPPDIPAVNTLRTYVTTVPVTTAVTTTFHNPSRERRREWQRAYLYRDTKQFCIDGWENDRSGMGVTTASIDNPLYSAIQNQAIREAKSDYKKDEKDGIVEYHASQPFAVNNQNWEIDRTETGSVVVGFPCISGWYTPSDVYDDIADDVARLVDGAADKSRLQVYRRGEDWFCTFAVEYESETGDGTAIGADIGHDHPLAADVETGESMLVSGREATYLRRNYSFNSERNPSRGRPNGRPRGGRASRPPRATTAADAPAETPTFSAGCGEGSHTGSADSPGGRRGSRAAFQPTSAVRGEPG